MENMPISEFDEDRSALIEPAIVYKNIGLPECCVIPFYGSVIEKLKQDERLELIHEFGSIIMPTPVYKLTHNTNSLTVVCPTACGAPLAGALLEELIAKGCRKFVACGSAGVLKTELSRGVIVIPTAAIRDEGTSYHYLPPSRTVTTEASVVDILEGVMQRHHVDYEVGMTWTTDAPYRETKKKIARRKEEGCLTVEMECSALITVAKFRNVCFGQYLLAGDDVSGDEWDSRDFNAKSPAHEKIFSLSVEACLEL